MTEFTQVADFGEVLYGRGGGEARQRRTYLSIKSE